MVRIDQSVQSFEKKITRQERSFNNTVSDNIYLILSSELMTVDSDLYFTFPYLNN